jgi:hypothetical protein
MVKRILTFLVLAASATASVCAQEKSVFYSAAMHPADPAVASYTLKLQPFENNRYKGVLTDALNQVRSTGEYVAVGKKYLEDGHFTYFYADGKIESEGEYVRGVKVGSWKRYDQAGKRKQDRYYPMDAANLIRDSMQIEKTDDENTSVKE